MKTLITFTLSLLLLAACNKGGTKGNDLESKKAELAKLQADAKDIEAKIAKLQEVIAKMDTTVKAKITDVFAVALTPQPFKTYIEVQGRVDADENVSLSSQIPGMVTKINVKVGQEVSKGQVLAETDASAIYQQISDLQTNLDLAKQVFQKQENLWKQKIGTEIQYLQAKTTKESLEKKMASLQEQVRMSKIISPINGTVDAVNIKIAQQIMPGMAAINVVNFSNLKVKADVAESYSARVKTGNEVQILFPDIKDSVAGKVHYASRAINTLTRTFGVEVLLSSNKDYHPNMVAKLRINDYSAPRPQIVVPVKYIQKGTNESFVMIFENDKAVKKVVKISHEYNGMAEISEGLKEGDMLITEGYDIINDNDQVNLKK